MLNLIETFTPSWFYKTVQKSPSWLLQLYGSSPHKCFLYFGWIYTR